jgi:hypothetical protein
MAGRSMDRGQGCEPLDGEAAYMDDCCQVHRMAECQQAAAVIAPSLLTSVAQPLELTLIQVGVKLV